MIFSMILTLIAVFVIIIYVIVLYNTLITRKNEVDNMMGSIDAILKKRYDLIPNLVIVVKQYSAFEKSLMEKLTALRSHSLRPDLGIEEKSLLSDQVSASMREFVLTVENYPNLKANESFLHLQRSIAILEEELSAARHVYNQAVTDYNNAREMFPAIIVVNQMQLKSKSVFSTTESETTTPDITAAFNA